MHPEDNETPDVPPELQGGGMGDAFESIGEEKNDLDKIFDKMLSEENIHHFTELNAMEITGFSTLGVIAKKYKIAIVQQWLLENLKLRVSKQRKGKAEFVKITSRTGYQEQPQIQQGGWNPFRR